MRNKIAITVAFLAALTCGLLLTRQQFAVTPVSYYVRTDGGTSSQCNGLVDAAYPGTGTGQACAFSSIESAKTLAVCGDFINMKAGQTFDYTSAVILTNKSCTSGTPITIRSTAYASLPSGRVAPANAANMARLRTTTANPVFVDTSGGSYWALQGLEITDNSSVDINVLMDFRNGTKIDLTQVYCHPKEANPDWSRAAARAMWYEGAAGLTVTKSYFAGFLGYNVAGTELQTSEVMLSITGKNVTFTNNFLSAWYGTLFSGGGGVGIPDYTATISGTPSTTAATLSTVTGLSVGQYVRVDFRGTGTKSGSSFTRVSGDVMTSADIPATALAVGAGLPIALAEAAGYVFHVSAISGNSWTIPSSVFTGLADGTYNWTTYEVVQIDSISGNNVTYHGVGSQAIAATPTTNTRMSWVTGDNGNSANWTFTQNEFWKDPEFVNYLKSINYPTYAGKGIVELKHIKHLTLVGNRFTGYPNAWFLRQYNQDGSEPWSTIQDINMTSNLFQTDSGVTDTGSTAFSINLGDPYFSAQPGKDVIVSNNLILGWETVSTGQYGSNVQIYHNTIVNTGVGPSYHTILTFDNAVSSGWVFRDNLGSYRFYGAQCLFGNNTLSACWPNGTWSKNVIVDTQNSGVTTNTWGTGSILGPVPTTFSQVGFVNPAAGDYGLAATSAYKGLGTGGTDPGVNMTTLNAALSASSPTPTPTPTPSPSPQYKATGTITLSGSPLSGTTVNLLQSSDRTLLASTQTNSLGIYSLDITAGTSIILSPVRAGYSFSPTEVLISPVAGNVTEDFAAGAPTPTPTPSVTPTPTPTPTPSPLPTCAPNQKIGNPATCYCPLPRKIIGNPPRCKP